MTPIYRQIVIALIKTLRLGFRELRKIGPASPVFREIDGTTSLFDMTEISAGIAAQWRRPSSHRFTGLGGSRRIHPKCLAGIGSVDRRAILRIDDRDRANWTTACGRRRPTW
jgi:hypothetical protein